MSDAADVPFAWPVGSYVAEELAARGWTSADLARRMGGDPGVDMLCVEMLLAVDDPDLVLDRETAEGMGRAFGVDPQFLLDLDRAWRERGPRPANANPANHAGFQWPLPALSGHEGAPEVIDLACRLAVGAGEHDAGCLLRMTASRRLVTVLAYDREFDPGMPGRLVFTLAVLDDMRREKDAPRSVGVILCRGMDPEVARLALKGWDMRGAVTDAPGAWEAYRTWVAGQPA